MNMDKLLTKRAILTILADRLYPELDRADKDAREDYRITGKTDKQKISWKTDEPVFDENGNPVYEDKWEYVMKEEDELTEEDKAKIAAVEIIRSALDKLI